MKQIIGAALALLLQAGLAQSETLSHLEIAARMNVAENLCDINFSGGPNPSGVVHHTMIAAAEMNISIEAAARMADARHAEIVSYLNRASKLDEFCCNARKGNI